MDSDNEKWHKMVQQHTDEKIDGVLTLLETKLNHQEAVLKTAYTHLESEQSIRLGILNDKVDNVLLETHQNKEVTSLQLNSLDTEIKKLRLDINEVTHKEDAVEVEYQSLTETLSSRIHNIESRLSEVTKLAEELVHAQEVAMANKAAVMEDPIRKFVTVNGQKILYTIIAGILFYAFSQFSG